MYIFGNMIKHEVEQDVANIYPKMVQAGEQPAKPNRQGGNKGWMGL